MTRGQALIWGVGVLALGGGSYWVFQSTGMEGFSPGVAASALLMLVVLAWTGSYLFRVVTGQMTYMEQRRRYRTTYDERANAELMARFEALSPTEQAELLRDLGQLDPREQVGAKDESEATAPPTP